MKESKYTKIHSRYQSRMASLKKQEEVKKIADAIKRGKLSVMKMKRLESCSFDMTWIKAIEDCIFDLGTIVKNPKKVTKTVTDLVPVELSKKIGSQSVIHLASHSENVKEIKENGDVVPNKILNIGSDDDYATYENRFIATLIRRLILFVEKRYDYIVHYSPFVDTEYLMLKNVSKIDGMDVEIETKVRISKPSTTDTLEYSNSYVEHIEKLRQYLRFYYNSDFMHILKHEKDVRNPIMQTNIIRKNPLYNHCYRLYKFLESYDKLGVNLKINETFETFDDKGFEELNSTLLANFLTLKADDPAIVTKHEEKTYKPKVLTSIDDESFVYGPLCAGPVEFVRVDAPYLEYISRKDPVPEHMTNAERTYYEVQIKRNAKRKDELAQINELISRKKKELKNWERYISNQIEIREREKEYIKRLMELDSLQADANRIEEARRRLQESAVKYDTKLQEVEKKKQEKLAKQAEKKLANKAKNVSGEAKKEKENVEIRVDLVVNEDKETITSTNVDSTTNNGNNKD